MGLQIRRRINVLICMWGFILFSEKPGKNIPGHQPNKSPQHDMQTSIYSNGKSFATGKPKPLASHPLIHTGFLGPPPGRNDPLVLPDHSGMRGSACWLLFEVDPSTHFILKDISIPRLATE